MRTKKLLAVGLVLTGLLAGSSGLVWSQSSSAERERPHNRRLVAPTDQPLRTVVQQGHAAPVVAVPVSADGTLLVSSSRDNTLKVWRLPHGHLIRTVRAGDTTASALSGSALSPDGRLVAAAHASGAVTLIRTHDGSRAQTLTGYVGDIEKKGLTSLAFSPDGNALAGGGDDRYIRIWRMPAGMLKTTLKQDAGVTAVAFSPDARLLASGGRGGRVTFWEVSKGAPLRTVQGHDWAVNSLSFSPDGRLLVSGGKDGLRFWSVSDGRLGERLNDRSDPVDRNWNWLGVNSVAFSPDGSRLAAGIESGGVLVWQLSGGAATRIATIRGETDAIRSVAFSPDGQLLLGGGGRGWYSDFGIRIWQVSDGSLVRRLEGGGLRVRALAFLPDGGSLVSAGDDSAIRIWNVRDGSLRRTLLGHADRVSGIAVSSDGSLLASGGWDGIRLWSLPDGQVLRSIARRDGRSVVESLALSADGRLVYIRA